MSVFWDIYFSIIENRILRRIASNCEGRPEGYEPMVQVDLRADSGDEISIQAKDKELYEKDINEGDWVYFDLNDEIFKEK